MDYPSLHTLLTQRRDDITARFVAEVQRKDLSPPGLARSTLTDHIPQFLDEIAEEITQRTNRQENQVAIDLEQTARQHGGQRWTVGYDLQGVVREYDVLRLAILETARQWKTHITIDDFDILAQCLNVGVAEAVTQYVAYRDAQAEEQRAEITFLTEAGELLTSSLDSSVTLRQLTELIVPRLADWCVVHVHGRSSEDLPLAHVDPTKLDALRAFYRSHPADLPYNDRTVRRTGKSEFIDDARSCLIVPLRIQSTVLGAVLLAREASREPFRTSDLLLAEELVRRAAVAMENGRLYEQAQKERAKAEAATRTKDEFVAMVSHELRTPLNAILGWTRLLRSGGVPETEQDQALKVIERSANAQNRLITDLLDVSKIIAGNVRLQHALVDLRNVIELAVESIRPAADAKRVRLDVDLTVDAARTNSVVRGDADRLQQILGNLLANAVKFTAPDGAIYVRLRYGETDAEMVVRDEGKGIDPAFLPYVFERFRQADIRPSRAHGGLGLGLTIAKHLVELHGGAIEAQSEGLGRGATFTVRLPLLSTQPVRSETPGDAHGFTLKQTASDANLPVGLQDIRVLIIDHDGDDRHQVVDLLTRCNMEVRSVASPADAVTLLAGFTPHVVLCNVDLADDDGYALVRQIRTQGAPGHHKAGAVALTASRREEDGMKALAEGFDVHLVTPVEPAVLVATLVDLAGRGSTT